MRMRHLHYFLIVAEEQNFSRAAARVHIEPSPLSRAMKDLESELGVRLLQRINGRIQLTLAGEVFREEARRMLAFMDNAKSRVKAAATGCRGQLRVGLANNLAQSRLTKLLARCREDEPRTAIRIEEMANKDLAKALGHDEIDIGFSVDTEAGNGLCTKVAWWDRLVIAIPKNHPLLSLDKIPLTEVIRYSLVLCHPDSCPGGYNIIHQWCCDTASPPLMIAQYISGIESMIMLVAAGYGIGLALESQITLYDHPDVIIRPVTDDVPPTPTLIVTRDKPPSDELSRFIARIQDIGQTEEA